jgi:hypothetical protein
MDMRESRKTKKYWIPASAGMTPEAAKQGVSAAR